MKIIKSRAEYDAQKEWLRDHPHGFEATSTRRALKRYEREQRALGVDLGAPAPGRRAAHRGWILELRGKVPSAQRVHCDRHCVYLADHDDDEIREATPEERERQPRCQGCCS